MLQESLLLGCSTAEVLAHFGVIGSCISLVQSAALESAQLADFRNIAGAAALFDFSAFAAALFIIYSVAPTVLRRCGAAAFNIAMLSSDLWSALARLFFFGGFGTAAAAGSFVGSFIIVSCGMCVYASGGDPLPPDKRAAANAWGGFGFGFGTGGGGGGGGGGATSTSAAAASSSSTYALPGEVLDMPMSGGASHVAKHSHTCMKSHTFSRARAVSLPSTPMTRGLLFLPVHAGGAYAGGRTRRLGPGEVDVSTSISLLGLGSCGVPFASPPAPPPTATRGGYELLPS